jgi:hypothetical protein
MPDRAPGRRAQHGMVPRHVARDSAHGRAGRAARFRDAWRGHDGGEGKGA